MVPWRGKSGGLSDVIVLFCAEKTLSFYGLSDNYKLEIKDGVLF